VIALAMGGLQRLIGVGMTPAVRFSLFSLFLLFGT
jgi:hypothetical protein